MKQQKTARTKKNWTELGLQALEGGDLTAAKHFLQRAIKADKNSASCRYDLALVQEALGEFGDAAEQFTEALRINPMMAEATRHLGLIVTRGALPADVRLNPWGLKLALENEVVNREQIAEAAIYVLAREKPMSDVLNEGRTKGWPEAAHALCMQKTGGLLKDELFLAALRDNVIRLPELEFLLTALRRALLLELPAERLKDKALTNAIAAMVKHCRVNEYVWFVSDEESEFLKNNPAPVKTAFEGDPEAAINLAIRALYAPIPSLVEGEQYRENVSAIRPQVIREVISEELENDASETEVIKNVRAIGSVENETTMRVASQYSKNPYPRWTSLGLLLRGGDWRNGIEKNFTGDRLKFMDEPFEVLIAGCGTGVQAISAAFSYGPNAKVTALDISLPSLGYAGRMAEYFDVPNIQFIRADIQELAQFDEMRGRFDVIESVGVLHHLADPYEGWRTLTKCLKDDGIMCIGLYSAIARAGLAKIRQDPAFPGVGCSDDELRTFRADLLLRSAGDAADEAKRIRDVYTTGSFRDLLLHVQEHCHTIPEIAAFMEDANLEFRGFFNHELFDELQNMFPDETWPGSFDAWAKFEEANPKRFFNMYRLWCEKK